MIVGRIKRGRHTLFPPKGHRGRLKIPYFSPTEIRTFSHFLFPRENLKGKRSDRIGKVLVELRHRMSLRAWPDPILRP